MKSALLRKSILTLGITAAGLILTPSDSLAGTGEAKLLVTQLGKPIANATTAELFAAVQSVITANPKKNPGVIAGEALKGAGANATDFGETLGEAIEDSTLSIPNVAAFIGAAAKTANTGKTPNGSQVAAFAAAILANDGDNADTLLAMKAAIGSKTAAGQIAGGRSLNLSDDDAFGLADTVAKDKKLKSAIQATSQYVGVNVGNIAEFATDLAAANTALLKSIAPGAAAGQPVGASDILEGLFDNATTKPNTVKFATTLAGSMSVVADTEVVTDMAIEFGERLADASIPFSKLSTLAKGLVTGLVKKPATDASVGGLTRDSLANKLDEIGEVAAYLLAGVNERVELDNLKKTPALIVKYIKTIVKAAKIKSIAGFQGEAASDVPGSVAQTLVSMNAAGDIPDDVFEAIKAKLLKSGKAIGGKALANVVTGAFNEVFNNTAGTKYEDGTNLSFLGVELTQPETDIRNG